jgi:hypothetical protein
VHVLVKLLQIINENARNITHKNRIIMFILRIMSAIKTLSGHNVGLFSVKCCGGVKLIV